MIHKISLIFAFRFLFYYLILFTFAGCSKQIVVTRESFPLPEDIEIVSDIEPGIYTRDLIMTEIQGPKSFNPFVIEDNHSAVAIIPLFSTLLEFNPINQSFKPGLAKAWSISEDNLKYTFLLRKGIKWSDGQDVTADDVIFSFDALFDDRYPNRIKTDLTIDGNPISYKKIDNYTIEFQTVKPYAPFINDITSIHILPKHILYESYENGTFQHQWTLETAINSPEKIVGTGPYCIQEFRPSERIVYKPNPHYWKVDIQGTRLPYIDTFIYNYVSDNNTALVLFSTGQIDAVGIGARDLPWVSKAAEKYDFSIYEIGPSASTGFIWFNMKPGKNNKGEYYVEPYKLKWFQDKRFRQAILYAINREGIIKANYLGHGELLSSIISPANKKWYNPNVIKYPYNPQKAKELFEEMGFKLHKQRLYQDNEGNLVEFNLLSPEGGDISMLTGIQENLKDIGITMNLTFMDFNTLIDKVGKTFIYESSIIGFASRGADPGDPSGIKAIIKSSGRFHLWDAEQKQPATHWEAEIDKLYNLQEEEMDESKRIELVRKIQYIFSEELPLLPLITPDVQVGIKNGWKNLKNAPMSSIFWNMEELWREKTD